MHGRSKRNHAISKSPEPSNPYESPQKMIEEALKTDHLLYRGVITVLVASIFFGVMGGAIGLLIGVLLPDYYITLFPGILRSESLESWQFGAALGLTQGAVAGVVVGCVVLLTTAWYKSRMNNSLAAMIAQYQALSQGRPQE